MQCKLPLLYLNNLCHVIVHTHTAKYTYVHGYACECVIEVGHAVCMRYVTCSPPVVHRSDVGPHFILLVEVSNTPISYAVV